MLFINSVMSCIHWITLFPIILSLLFLFNLFLCVSGFTLCDFAHYALRFPCLAVVNSPPREGGAAWCYRVGWWSLVLIPGYCWRLMLWTCLQPPNAWKMLIPRCQNVFNTNASHLMFAFISGGIILAAGTGTARLVLQYGGVRYIVLINGNNSNVVGCILGSIPLLPGCGSVFL